MPEAAPVTTATRLMWVSSASPCWTGRVWRGVWRSRLREWCEVDGTGVRVGERAVVAADVDVAVDRPYERYADRAWPAGVCGGGLECGEAQVVADPALDAYDPEAAELGGEPDLPARREIPDVAPRLVKLRLRRRVDVGRVEICDFSRLLRVANIEEAQSGVPHRRHDERRVLRIVDVVVVHGVVFIRVVLVLAVLHLVDGQSELRNRLRMSRVTDVGEPR